MKIIYYDCFAGISGDMNLGALIDLGADRNYLFDELKKLNVGPYRIDINNDSRKGICGTRVDVVLPSESIHAREDHHHHHHHEHTLFKDIRLYIETSRLSDKVKKTSMDIFMKLAEAEAKIHGYDIDDVAFHEVGAVDSIVDIVGAAICLENLKVNKVYSSPVQVGGGVVKCDHGILPVPAPATVEILRGIPIRSGLVPFEATTPTGAAILAAVVDRFIESYDFIPEKIGYGIGQRDTDVPNVLRVMLCETEDGEDHPGAGTNEALFLETNIDDMSPESYEFIIDQFFKSGALDVYLTPVIMKKSRPAVKISILCNPENFRDVAEVVWLHTTTFGLRLNKITKVMLERDFSRVKTKYGEISVKNGYLRGKKIKSKPEYEDCKRLAGAAGVSIQDIYRSLHEKNEE